MSKGKLRNYDPQAPSNQAAKGLMINVAVEQMDHALARAENWARNREYDYTDAEYDQIADDFYQNVFTTVVRNCLRVYQARAKANEDELKYLDDIESRITDDELLERSILKTATALSQSWLDKRGEGYRKEAARSILFHIYRQIAYVSLLMTETDESKGTDHEAQSAALSSNFTALMDGEEFKHQYDVHLLQIAEFVLENELKPVDMPLKSLRAFAGVLGIEEWTKKQVEQVEAVTDMLATAEPHIPDRYMLSMSMMPSKTIDRAARGPQNWAHPVDDAPTFFDANSNHTITYFAEGLTQKALREAVNQLNPRTADVWRLCTAAILEGWQRGKDEPSAVWIDARQLCDAMGFTKHHNGGHFPQNVAIATQALVDLERFYITIPHGEQQYPQDPKTGRRKKVKLEARARFKVLRLDGREEARELPGGKYVALRWLISAGEWIKAYPREQFAPLFRALVELPGGYTSDLWAKAIGTELIWQYRMDKGPQKVQRVETMLKQACVLEEAIKEKRKGRVRGYFEKAMDKLQEGGVCQSWEYNGGDIDAVESTTRGWFERWLQVRVIVTPPAEVVEVMSQIAAVSGEYRKKAEKAAMRKQLAN